MRVIKRFLSNISIKLIIIVNRHKFSIVLKSLKSHQSAIFKKAYCSTFALFPTNDLKTNSELATLITQKLFNSTSTENSKSDKKEVEALYQSMVKSKWVTSTISDYYRTQQFGYSISFSAEAHKEEAEAAKNKAEHWVAGSTSTPLDLNTVEETYNKIKITTKSLTKEIKQLNSERILQEKRNIIGNIKITPSHITFLLSLFSIYFTLGGFIYNTLLFKSLGTPISYFFTISDYFDSSIEIITQALISTVAGAISFIFGLNNAFERTIHANQFQIEPQASLTQKFADSLIATTVVILTVLSAIYYHKTKTIPYAMLYPIIVILIFKITPNLPIWKYISNSKTSISTILSSTIFFTQIILLTTTKAIEIKSNIYTPLYSPNYTKEYQDLKPLKFISTNSKYIFLWDVNNKNVRIVPNSAVESYQSK